MWTKRRLLDAFIGPWVTSIALALALFSGSILLWSYHLRRAVNPDILPYEAYIVGGVSAASLLTYFIIVIIDPRSSNLRGSVKSLHTALKKSPWYWTTTIIIPVCAGLLIIWFGVKRFLTPEVAAYEREVLTWIGLGTVLAYFVGITLSAMLLLDRERQDQETKKVFGSVRGILSNGREVSVAMRVQTITLFLERLCSGLDPNQQRPKEVNQLMYACGVEAGQNFSNEFPRIYEKDIRPRGRPMDWHQLTLDDKLKEWFQYESDNGLGQIEHETEAPGKGAPAVVNIRVHHDRGLFHRRGGIAFSHFLAGACAAVLTAMLEEHNKHSPNSLWRYYNAVSQVNVIPWPDENYAATILLKYEMKYEVKESKP